MPSSTVSLLLEQALEAHTKDRDFDKGYKLLKKALKKEYKIPKKRRYLAYHMWAVYMHMYGNNKEAIKYAKKSIKYNSTFIDPKLLLLELDPENSGHHAYELIQYINHGTFPDKQSIRYCLWGVGMYLDNYRKDYEEAFKCFEEMNRLLLEETREKHDVDQLKDIIDFMQEYNIKFPPFDTKPDGGDKIIFICGVPRSGTTLINQILTGHPEITSKGEIKKFSDICKEIITKDQRYLPVHYIFTSLDEYFDLMDVKNEDYRYIIDKLPANWTFIPMINLFIPDAKIIHVSRDLPDNALSAFKFLPATDEHRWSYSWETIKGYWEADKEMIKWINKYNFKNVYDLKYEDFVNNPEEEFKKLCEWLEIKDDEADNCLSPEKNTDVITTASISQARKPINNKSIGKWKNYKDYIPEFIYAAQT